MAITLGVGQGVICSNPCLVFNCCIRLCCVCAGMAGLQLTFCHVRQGLKHPLRVATAIHD